MACCRHCGPAHLCLDHEIKHVRSLLRELDADLAALNGKKAALHDLLAALTGATERRGSKTGEPALKGCG